MKILDRYVAKNFLIGYAIAFAVLIGLRILIDLFLKIDEFTEHANLGTMVVIKNIVTFYGLNCTLYFRDFSGMITVVAASFSFGRMVRCNELVAVMASGVSLKRIIGPIIFLALLLTGVLVADQEWLIPRLADKLVRSHDAVPGQESYDVRFISDGNGSLINSQRFDVGTSTFYNPTILLRKPIKPGIWQVTARIDAGKAVYDERMHRWNLYTPDPNDPNSSQWSVLASDPNEGRWLPYGRLIERGSSHKPLHISSYTSDITPRDIPIMGKSEHKTLLGLRQLNTLAARGTQVRDLAQLYSQKHFRITDPIINLVMLMISLPLLVCRDPKSMKSAVTLSFALTGACFVTTFICKILATEVVFDKVMPELWAWLPVFIFLPIAFIELDSMKT
ncbi:MAG: LptF/LptG family permease [Sedimentisphaerales bacterium]|jgi:lipopolysaccharide export system permease protein